MLSHITVKYAHDILNATESMVISKIYWAKLNFVLSFLNAWVRSVNLVVNV